MESGFESRPCSIAPWNRPCEGRCVAGGERFARRAPRFDRGTSEIACSPATSIARVRRAGQTCSPVVKRSVASVIARSEVRILPEGLAPFRSSAAEHADPRKGSSRLAYSPEYIAIRGEDVRYFALTARGRVRFPRAERPKLMASASSASIVPGSRQCFAGGEEAHTSVMGSNPVEPERARSSVVRACGSRLFPGNIATST